MILSHYFHTIQIKEEEGGAEELGEVEEGEEAAEGVVNIETILFLNSSSLVSRCRNAVAV